MDAERFDRLARALSGAGTRRGLLRLAAAVPMASGLRMLLHQEEVQAGKGKDGKGGHGRNGGHGGKGGKGGKGGNGYKGHKGKNHSRTSPSTSPSTSASDPCAWKDNGAACGPGGSTSHCCQGGVCTPPLTCLSRFETCGTVAECEQKCCSRRAGCAGSDDPNCSCASNGPGGFCGSDADCRESICVCGTCCCPICGEDGTKACLGSCVPCPS
jgi:hypothetical protein